MAKDQQVQHGRVRRQAVQGECVLELGAQNLGGQVFSTRTACPWAKCTQAEYTFH